jgi:hypothetical protein
VITDTRVKELALSLFQQSSSRDSQKLVGASDFSDPCEYHLASKLKGIEQPAFKYWMGARIGTAVHEFLEARIPTSDLEAYPEFGSARIEQTIRLGNLEGYGEIKSKPDLALLDNKHLIDWKTSNRKKTKALQAVIFEGKDDPEASYTLRRYYAQVQIYAWGLNKNDMPVDGCSLVFINRDGTYDPDLWTWTFDYDEKFALEIWHRLERIWKELQSGKELELFPREEHCFNCKVLDS